MLEVTVDLKVHNSLDSVTNISNAVVTTGTFDGVHLGHQKILKKLNKLANYCEGESVLFTFFPHPRMVLFPHDHGLKLLNTLEEKKERLAASGLDHLIVHPFSPEFSRLSALQYVRDIMVNTLSVHTMVVGYDHHFGRNREGNLELLNEFSQTYDFGIEVISALDVEEVNVSSTKIRRSIGEGNIHLANEYLGYKYSFTGEVIEGEKRGRLLGFNTANIEISSELKIIPSFGVYAVNVLLCGQSYKGMLNIGVNPTFNNEHKTHIEVHILDFDSDIYGESLTIELVKKLRDEKKFNSKEDLVQQLNEDKRLTIETLR